MRNRSSYPESGCMVESIRCAYGIFAPKNPKIASEEVFAKYKQEKSSLAEVDG